MLKKPASLQDELDRTVSENAVELQDFMDVEYELQIIVGSTFVTVGYLLALREGDTVKLDRHSTDHIRLAIDDLTIGEAEVVVTKTGTSARLVSIG